MYSCKPKAILWDFDGVLLQSNEVRDSGFQIVLKDYPEEQVGALMDYHRSNGGLSRYVKFRYFFEVIRNETVTEETIKELSAEFSIIMRQHLTNAALLIQETLNFVQLNFADIPMFIVSGSDQNELQYLCNELKISNYFRSITGSPTPKIQLVRSVIEEFGLKPNDCLLIGDSINDFEAAEKNGLHFMAYNNESIEYLTTYRLSLTV